MRTAPRHGRLPYPVLTDRAPFRHSPGVRFTALPDIFVRDEGYYHCNAIHQISPQGTAGAGPLTARASE